MSGGAFAPQITTSPLMSGLCSCKFFFPFYFLFNHVCIVRALPFNYAIISDRLLVFIDFV